MRETCNETATRNVVNRDPGRHRYTHANNRFFGYTTLKSDQYRPLISTLPPMVNAPRPVGFVNIESSEHRCLAAKKRRRPSTT
jgi:hypothetical protein